MYDVIVVGAGPAGCTAAKVLAENGYQVLLLEKWSVRLRRWNKKESKRDAILSM